MSTKQNMSDYHIAKIADSIVSIKPELKREIMRLSFQLEDLRLEITKLKNEMQLVKKPEVKQIPYRGTIS